MDGVGTDKLPVGAEEIAAILHHFLLAAFLARLLSCYLGYFPANPNLSPSCGEIVIKMAKSYLACGRARYRAVPAHCAARAPAAAHFGRVRCRHARRDRGKAR